MHRIAGLVLDPYLNARSLGEIIETGISRNAQWALAPLPENISMPCVRLRLQEAGKKAGADLLPVTKADNRDEDWQWLRHHHHGYYFVYRHDAIDVADVAGRKPNGHREGGWHVNCAYHLNGRCGRRSA
jgi:hypothetical protein